MEFKFSCDFIEFESKVWYRGIDFEYESQQLLEVLNQATKENDVQSYIKSSEKWFIPASLFKDYDFGHHEAFLLPEKSLGAEYRVDYLLIGKNSGGYHFVFVEFEDVNVPYKLLRSNEESSPVRKGLVQINDWKRWMDKNKEYFLSNLGLPFKVFNISSWSIHYCLVVSRREKMDDIAREMREQKAFDIPGLRIVSYDRLVDNVRRLTNGF